jgi:hypothetical protein
LTRFFLFTVAEQQQADGAVAVAVFDVDQRRSILWLGLCVLTFAGGRSSRKPGHDCSKADRFPLCEATRVRQANAKALPEGFADHNIADYPIWCSLGAIGSMAASCANPNIGIMN